MDIMSGNAISSNSMSLLERSMGFLWTKQGAILENIVNAETPGYQPKVVTFEDELRAKLERAQTGPKPRVAVRQVLEETAPTVTEVRQSVREDGNGVNITEQNVELLRNTYQLQYVFSAINSDLAALRTAIRGQ